MILRDSWIYYYTFELYDHLISYLLEVQFSDILSELKYWKMCRFQLNSFSNSLIYHLWPSNCSSFWAFLWKPFAQNHTKWLHCLAGEMCDITLCSLYFFLSSTDGSIIPFCIFFHHKIYFIVIYKRSENILTQQLLGFVVI